MDLSYTLDSADQLIKPGGGYHPFQWLAASFLRNHAGNYPDAGKRFSFLAQNTSQISK